MIRLYGWLCGLMLALALAQPALAQELPASSPAPTISLVTFAPGEVYWQRFGHNALLVREPSGAGRVYNYGIFDFQQKNFFLNFARGRMLYRLDEAPLAWVLRAYASEGRWALEQELALSPQQARAAADYLAWNARPENADYRYDYFLANCSTKTRDVIDRVLQGSLHAQLQARLAGISFRSEVLGLMAPMPLLMHGMDLGLGSRVDGELDQWQAGFIPMRLMDALREVRIADAQGAQMPLVRSERWLLGQASAPLAAASGASGASWPAFLFVGLALAALLAGCWRARDRVAARGVFGVLGSALVLVWAVAGTVLLLGWLGTEHWAVAANHNLLLLHPLWWLLLALPVGLARRLPRPPGRLVRAVAWFALLLSLLSLPVALFGPQPHLHWVLLLLPAQVTLLALALRSGRRA